MTRTETPFRSERHDENHRIDPREAVAFYAVCVWDRERFIEWVRDRSNCDRETAEQIADFDSGEGRA